MPLRNLLSWVPGSFYRHEISTSDLNPGVQVRLCLTAEPSTQSNRHYKVHVFVGFAKKLESF